MNLKIILLFLLLGIKSYSQDHLFPKETFSQYKIDIKSSYSNNNINLEVNNILKSPLRLVVYTDNEALNKKYKLYDTITISTSEIVNKKYYVPSKKAFTYYYNTYLGNPEQTINKNKIALPFLKGKSYRIIQGYNGTYSHNNDYNRYAIDFDLKVNDTICSADDGVVVGVIKDYKHGGSSQLWRENDRSNFITIYHPHSGIYTQYVHLVYDGSFVKIGDEVKKGQPIALSGMTGFTDISHLHFNVLIPKKGGTFVSTPITFENDMDGEDLKRGDKIKH
ncbi:M23 family metallopeptidase [Flavobacterium sp. I3-2]|uniref:M23 family metallopeptidase n=1 Tax=Flavobacterium sp. I3-2 TaxID=2748319 RepID=UPI0015A94BFA|nr:M23 family metallopeptidase [Flavobacterium sp. I3-2]